MKEYIIISPTADRAMSTWDYALDQLDEKVLQKSRRTHSIETADVRLRFLSEKQAAPVTSGTRATVMMDYEFEKKLDAFMASQKRTVHIGDEVRFDAFKGIRSPGFACCGQEIVIGKVVYINEAHQWFEAEYTLGGEVLKIAFKFTDVDDEYGTVTIVKRRGKKHERK